MTFKIIHSPCQMGQIRISNTHVQLGDLDVQVNSLQE